MPGQVGNFSMAAHPATWGKPFNQLDRLRLNDAIVIETEQGWYTYRFRTLEYVTPDSVDVLDPVPQAPEAAPAAVHHAHGVLAARGRIVAYGVFEKLPAEALGAPASLKAVS
jgi:sortase A